MAVVYRCVGILTVDVIFFRSPGVCHSQDSFPSTFRPRLWETSSGVVAVGVFAAVARRGEVTESLENEQSSLYLRHNSFSNPSVASPTSQLILQPIFRLSYVTGFSLKSPGEPPMVMESAGDSTSRLWSLVPLLLPRTVSKLARTYWVLKPVTRLYKHNCCILNIFNFSARTYYILIIRLLCNLRESVDVHLISFIVGLFILIHSIYSKTCFFLFY